MGGMYCQDSTADRTLNDWVVLLPPNPVGERRSLSRPDDGLFAMAGPFRPFRQRYTRSARRRSRSRPPTEAPTAMPMIAPSETPGWVGGRGGSGGVDGAFNTGDGDGLGRGGAGAGDGGDAVGGGSGGPTAKEVTSIADGSMPSVEANADVMISLSSASSVAEGSGPATVTTSRSPNPTTCHRSKRHPPQNREYWGKGQGKGLGK